MGAIGVGLGAFFAGLAATDGLIKILGFFGADGTGIRDLMINLAAGLNPLSSLDGANLIAVGGSMVSLGAGLVALLGGQALGSILDFVGRIFGKNDEEDVFQKIYRGLLPLSTLNADNLQGLSDIGEKIDIVTNSVERFGKVNFNKIARMTGFKCIHRPKKAVEDIISGLESKLITLKELQESVNIPEDDPIRKVPTGAAMKYAPVRNPSNL